MKSRYNPVLIAVIAISFIWSLWVNVLRMDVESSNKSVEMTMEYEGLLKLAALEGKPVDEVLLAFKDAGINSLMIFDTNLERLTKKGAIRSATGGELRQAASLGASKGVFAAVPVAELEENAVYIAEGSDTDVLDDVREDLQLRFGAERVREVSAAPRIIKIKGSTTALPEGRYDEPQGLLQSSLGLPVRDMQHVHSLGFNVIVRPHNYVNVDEAKIDSIFKRIAKSGVPVHEYMPTGTEVVGYPKKIEYMGDKMNEIGMKLIMMEHYTQLQFAKIEGLVPLSEFVHYNAARSYVIDATEQKKISVGTALARWALTDEERNIRVNYIRPFLLPVEGEDIMQTNLQYVRDIKKNVEARGFQIGEAGVFKAPMSEKTHIGFAPYQRKNVEMLPFMAAVFAALAMYVGMLLNWKRRTEIVVWAVYTVMFGALLLFSRGLFLRQMLALAAASVFPVLSMDVIFSIWDKNKTSDNGTLKIAFNACWQLALAIALSLVGASFLSALLADSRFLLEIDIYRGVKLTFLMPLVLTAILYLKRYDMLSVVGKGVKTLLARLNAILDTGLTFKHVAVLFVLLFIVFYFVGRSGHTGGVPVPAIELKMRAFLEQLMYARPREKEFMIGHPAFFVAAFAAYKCAPRWWQFALACAAVIGQGSLVQTFCHMRTPVFMSLARALDGYAVGIVFGLAAVLVLGLVTPYAVKLKRRYLE